MPLTHLPGLTNADQRLTEDVEKFAFSIADLYSYTFKPLLDVLLFTRSLARIMGYRGQARQNYVTSNITEEFGSNWETAFGEVIVNAMHVCNVGLRTHTRINRCSPFTAFLRACWA
jgi:hypothetical protein